MYCEEWEELIQIEAEELSEALFGATYFDLSLELQECIRRRVIQSFWPEYAQEDSTAIQQDSLVAV
jgi:hypothetical protein